MREKELVEQQMSQSLTEGKMERLDPQAAARDRLTPRYEIRIPAKMDPIVEETELFRARAEEVDERYDDYIRKASR
jgi:hypothetical protein